MFVFVLWRLRDHYLIHLYAVIPRIGGVMSRWGTNTAGRHGGHVFLWCPAFMMRWNDCDTL